MRPFFYVVAGPNGVGKSTASFQYMPSDVELNFFNEPNTLTLIDSSDRLEIIYQRVDGQITIQTPTLPAWVTISLKTHFSISIPNQSTARASDTIDQVRTMYQQRELTNPTDEQTPPQ